MTGKTHIAIGVATGLALGKGLPLEKQLIIVTAAVVGSLAPDLDHPNGALNQKLLKVNNNFFRLLMYGLCSVAFLYLYLYKNLDLFLPISIITLVVGVSGHRSFTHSIIGTLAFGFIAKAIGAELNEGLIYEGFIAGYISHLVADFFTPKGIKLFFPAKVSIASPISLKSSSPLEDFIFLAFSVYSILMMMNFIKL